MLSKAHVNKWMGSGFPQRISLKIKLNKFSEHTEGGKIEIQNSVVVIQLTQYDSKSPG